MPRHRKTITTVKKGLVPSPAIKEDFEPEPEPVYAYCPICNEENLPMGKLGKLLWFDCRACGMRYSRYEHEC